MACLVKMKTLKSSSEEEGVRGKKQNKTQSHIKRPYLASSQGVLALAFNGLLSALQSRSDFGGWGGVWTPVAW